MQVLKDTGNERPSSWIGGLPGGDGLAALVNSVFAELTGLHPLCLCAGRVPLVEQKVWTLGWVCAEPRVVGLWVPNG